MNTQHRVVGGLQLSTLGHGSYLGETDPAACENYQRAMLAAMQGGVNVLDTASTYRGGQSEVDLGLAMQQFFQAGGARDELFVVSKAGFTADGHCIEPEFITARLDDSLARLQIECLDAMLIHNPEETTGENFYPAMGAAFLQLEKEVQAGRLRSYGIATWDGLRISQDQPRHLSLLKLVHEAGIAAQQLFGRADRHHFRVIEMPVNLAMTEAILAPTQAWKFGDQAALHCAKEVGMLTLASASLCQCKILQQIPAIWLEALAQEPVLAALQFTRSAPGVDVALVGMGQVAHAEQLSEYCRQKPSPYVQTLLGEGGPHG